VEFGDQPFLLVLISLVPFFVAPNSELHTPTGALLNMQFDDIAFIHLMISLHPLAVIFFRTPDPGVPEFG
jgi:hypothetical protein